MEANPNFWMAQEGWGDGAALPRASGPWSVNLGNSSSWAICPDLLTLDKIGEADGPRGKVVRTFFRAMRLWPPRGS